MNDGDDDMLEGGAAAPASADAVARGIPTRASSAESAATLRPPREPARPAGQRRELVPARPGQPCEDKLKAKNAENARLREELKAELDRRRQLEKRVAELERQLEVAKKPYRIRPHGDMGP